tara:strand:+ start:1164 stop:1586 length:423 start_codon:yes stop_codon:yes gene_type:complete
MILKINENILINTSELKFKSIKSSGSGGQNINKNSTAVFLHFDILGSRSISNKIKSKILKRKNKYLTKSGKIIIKANTYKSQNQNKSDAILRFIKLLKNAMIQKKKRIKTSPKKSSILKRLDDKRKNSLKKKFRKKQSFE